MSWLRNPWGKPRGLLVVTALYILWSIVPVAIAILFAFNDGRSRTTWQGFSFRWFTGSSGSVVHDPALQGALKHTLLLAVICVGVAVPLGVAVTAGVTAYALILVYEWTHFLIHTAYRPRSRYYRSIWRTHRLHHFKNEQYWHGITNTVSDRVLGTYPEAGAVRKSRTARSLPS